MHCVYLTTNVCTLMGVRQFPEHYSASHGSFALTVEVMEYVDATYLPSK